MNVVLVAIISQWKKKFHVCLRTVYSEVAMFAQIFKSWVEKFKAGSRTFTMKTEFGQWFFAAIRKLVFMISVWMLSAFSISLTHFTELQRQWFMKCTSYITLIYYFVTFATLCGAPVGSLQPSPKTLVFWLVSATAFKCQSLSCLRLTDS